MKMRLIEASGQLSILDMFNSMIEIYGLNINRSNQKLQNLILWGEYYISRNFAN